MALPGTFATPMTIYGILGAAIGFPIGGIKGSVKGGIGGVGLGALIGLAKRANPNDPDAAVPEIWQRDTRRSSLLPTSEILPPGIMEGMGGRGGKASDYQIDLSQFEGLSTFGKAWGAIPIGDVGGVFNPSSRTILGDVTVMGWDPDLGPSSIETNMMNFVGVTPVNQDDLVVLFDWMAYLAYNMKNSSSDAGEHGITTVRADSTVAGYRARLERCGNTRLTQDESIGQPSQMVCGLRVIRAMVKAVEGSPAAVDVVAARLARNYYENVEKPLLGKETATRYVPAALVGAVRPPAPSSSSSSSSSSGSSTYSRPSDTQVAFFERRGVKIGAGVLGGALLITIIALAASGRKKRAPGV